MSEGVAPPSPSPRTTPWSWVRSHLVPQRGAIAVILVLSAGATAVALTPPFLIKLLLDDAILARDASRLFPLIGALVGLSVLGVGLSIANQWFHTRTSGRVLFALRESLYRHLASLSPRTLARHPEGDLLARLDGDVAEIQRFALDSVLALASGSLGLLATVGLLVVLSPRLALVAALLVPLEWLFLRWVRPHLARQTGALRTHTSTLTSFFVERLPALKAIQSAGTQREEAARLGALHRDYLADLLRAGLWNGGAAAGPRLLSTGAQAAVFGLGGLSVIGGSLSLGSLMAFSAYLAQAGRPVQTLFGIYTALARARVSIDRVRALTRLEAEVSQPTSPQALPDASTGDVGDIVFENVSFAHPEGPALLEDASCKIPAGSRVFLRGASGIGKSTWVDLLARHYDPDRGAIRLDGKDLRDLDLVELRRSVAVVGQGSVLFRGTLADNLRYGNPHAEPADLQRAAEAAELGAFLGRRDAGLDTQIASGGRGLSGGEAQRVLLARAFLQSPRVLVLDEATSEVDGGVEALLLDCVDRLFARSTRIVIQHHSAGAGRPGDLRLELAGGGIRGRDAQVA